MKTGARLSVRVEIKTTNHRVGNDAKSRKNTFVTSAFATLNSVRF